MFERQVDEKKLKLSGFNNLTKVLSFNLYDFCLTLSENQKNDYVNFIHGKYNANKITEISKKICNLIDATVLSISKQDYEPVGASTMVLMSDLKGGGWDEPKEGGTTVSMHLDKSHVCAHTYPDAGDPNGICSFRVDIDIATCGDIIPLSAMNLLFESFECDVVVIDYVVRGYTRLTDGTKIYNDNKIESIQEFIKPEILKNYELKEDTNLPLVNTWQTKLMIKDFGPERYLYDPKDSGHPEIGKKMDRLRSEMKEVFHQIN